MTPAYLPLTVAAAVAAGASGVLAAWWSWPVLLAVARPAVQQVGHDFVPLTTTADDVWDWTPLYTICQAHGLRWPLIGRVGNAGQFNEPAIIAPWAERRRPGLLRVAVAEARTARSTGPRSRPRLADRPAWWS